MFRKGLKHVYLRGFNKFTDKWKGIEKKQDKAAGLGESKEENPLFGMFQMNKSYASAFLFIGLFTGSLIIYSKQNN
jgi:hypothetical protein